MNIPRIQINGDSINSIVLTISYRIGEDVTDDDYFYILYSSDDNKDNIKTNGTCLEPLLSSPAENKVSFNLTNLVSKEDYENGRLKFYINNNVTDVGGDGKNCSIYLTSWKVEARSSTTNNMVEWVWNTNVKNTGPLTFNLTANIKDGYMGVSDTFPIHYSLDGKNYSPFSARSM